MLSWIVETALQRRLLVLPAAVLLLILGVRAARDAPLDVFPEFARPTIEIQTEAPGLSTEEVEGLVTLPIEGALAGVPDLETLRSKTVLGLSSVVLLLREGADVLAARQLVQERLGAEAARLPAAARSPRILPQLSSTSRALKIGLSSKVLSQLELSELVRWTVRPRLMAVPGVAGVAVWGQRDPQLQVLVDPARLAAEGVTLDAVVRAAEGAALPSAGGFVDTPGQRLPVRHLSSIAGPADLGAAVLAPRGPGDVALRLDDVARVVRGHAPPIGDAVINGDAGLLLIVEKQPAANTLAVTRGVDQALSALRPGLRDVDIDPAIFRPAGFIERSLRNLRAAILLGSALVVLVLLLFLRDLRAAAISLAAIPLSLVAALLVLRLRGGTLDTMFLAGLVIALGEVVDDAIIDVENIRRRLRAAAAAPADPSSPPSSPDSPPPSPLRVVLAASLEVRSSVVYASLIVCLVFLPVFFLDGLAGAFFRPLALAYVLAILASLGVALTVTPALALLLLPTAAAPRPDLPLLQALHRGYARLLGPLLARPRRALAIAGATSLAALLALPLLGEELLPDFKETDFLMHWVERPGTSVEASRRSTLRISRELLQIPGVRSFGAHIGRATAGDEVVGPNFTEHWISVDPDADYERTLAAVQAVVAGYPGVFRDVLTYLRERIKDVLSGASGAVVVRLFGPEQAELRRSAEAAAALMAQVPGVVDLKIEPQVLVPQIEVRLRPERLALHGLSAAQVRRAASTLVSGLRAGEVYERQRSEEIVVWGTEASRADPAALRRLLIDAPDGSRVPLGAVAEVVVVPAPSEIKREAGSRRLDVTCNVRGADMGAAARAIEARVRALPFPRGYHPEFLGEHAARQASRDRLLGLSLVSLAGIFALLYLDFRSLRLALLLLGTLPLALAGGVIGALLSGGALSLGSIVGFVSVLGIAARNGIMILSHYEHLQAREGVPFGPELLLRGAQERLGPVLMTALCAALALLPIVVRGAVPGYEIEHPMAVVIVGGLVSSTVLTLLLLPALYGRYGRRP